MDLIEFKLKIELNFPSLYLDWNNYAVKHSLVSAAHLVAYFVHTEPHFFSPHVTLRAS